MSIKQRVTAVKTMLRGRLIDKEYNQAVALIEDLGTMVSELIDERDQLEADADTRRL